MDLIIDCACSLELAYCLSRNIFQKTKNLRCLKEELIYLYVPLCQTTAPHILEQHLINIWFIINNLNGAQVLGSTIRVDHVAKYKKKEEGDEEEDERKREERGVCHASQIGSASGSRTQPPKEHTTEKETHTPFDYETREQEDVASRDELPKKERKKRRTNKKRAPRDDTSKLKEIGSTTHFQCPMLKGTNYTTWPIRMQIILEANGLWEMIEPNEKTEANTKKDKTAIAFLYQALPEEQLLQITKHKTTKAIWDALKIRHVGVNRVQQAKQQTLKSEFEMLQMNENESIDSYVTRFTDIINKAASVGLAYEDSTLVRKLLNAVPNRFLQIVASMEQYSDLDEMSLDEAIGRLKTFEERLRYKNERPVNNQESLMFTRHEGQRKPFREYGQGRFNQSRGRVQDKNNYQPKKKNGRLLKKIQEINLNIHQSHESCVVGLSAVIISSIMILKCEYGVGFAAVLAVLKPERLKVDRARNE
nr:zinc finger, CCHC-type [Tanacetum cinerariifolium]